MAVEPEKAGSRVRCAQCGAWAEVPELLPPADSEDHSPAISQPGPWADTPPDLSASGAEPAPARKGSLNRPQPERSGPARKGAAEDDGAASGGTAKPDDASAESPRSAGGPAAGKKPQQTADAAPTGRCVPLQARSGVPPVRVLRAVPEPTGQVPARLPKKHRAAESAPPGCPSGESAARVGSAAKAATARKGSEKKHSRQAPKATAKPESPTALPAEGSTGGPSDCESSARSPGEVGGPDVWSRPKATAGVPRSRLSRPIDARCARRAVRD